MIEQVIQLAAVLIGSGVAILTFTKGYSEYRLQGIQKRIDLFIRLRQRLKENDTFKEIARLIEANQDDNEAKSKLRDMDFKEKRDYVGFLRKLH